MSASDTQADSARGQASDLQLPLEGVTVLDLTTLLPGAFCTLLLADLGAEVVKVEEPTSGDGLRHVPPTRRGLGVVFAMANRDKKSVTINLKEGEGRQLLYRLAREVDVFVHSYRPETASTLGVDYPAIQEANPDVVYCSIVGYEPESERGDYPGHDLNFLSYSGALRELFPHSEPRVPGVQLADMGSGALPGAVGILAYLLRKSSTGEGGQVVVPMSEGFLWWLMPQIASVVTGESGLQGMVDGSQPFYDVYETRDGKYVSLASIEPKFWSKLCEVLGIPEFEDNQRSQEHRDEIRRRLADVFSSRTREEWRDQLEEEEVCFSPVLGLEEVVSRELQREDGLVSVSQGFPVVKSPLRSLELEAGEYAAAPELGEHTADVLKRYLDVGDEELGDLESEGVVRT